MNEYGLTLNEIECALRMQRFREEEEEEEEEGEGKDGDENGVEPKKLMMCARETRHLIFVFFLLFQECHRPF